MRYRSSGISLCLAILFLAASIPVTGWTQQDQVQAEKANALYAQNRRIEALPLYEELAKAHPDQWFYQERLADCLIAVSSQKSDPAEIKSMLARARDAARRAIELGDTQAYMHDIARIDPEKALDKGTSPGVALIEEGEKAFTANDLDTAMAKYQQAAEADPNLYQAPLFAGDMAYRQKDLPTAAKWFARAVAVNPDIETAYRYWGDAIYYFGHDPAAAREKYIEAIVAEPYNRKPWQRLQQYADAQKIVMAAPKIDRPAGPVVDPKKPNTINIAIDPSTADEKKQPGAFAWMMYSLMRASYQGDHFKKDFPDEKTYRHTLKEESSALSFVAKSIEDKKIPKEKLDESLRNLVELKQAGMLDCWILINGADQGIAQDYDAYRKEHRQLLYDYIDRFVLHGAETSQTAK
ncbi:MAG: tetratricopeptide repeat protein [Acidobacteriaceae bacterium]|nr:tetratricopeptide repeat protein [Acidobacteriaceae bacterium]